MEDSPSRDIFGKPPVAPVNAEPTLNSSPAHAPLSGVDGDIKQAFGDRSAGRNLRDDLLMAADNVTSAMSSLVKELNSGKYVHASLLSKRFLMHGGSVTGQLEHWTCTREVPSFFYPSLAEFFPWRSRVEILGHACN